MEKESGLDIDSNEFPIILFDGVCLLCHRSIKWIIDRDPEARFRFASLQSETGMKLLEQYNYKADMSSVILMDQNQIFVKSEAAFKVLKRLHTPFRIISAIGVLPKFILDPIYMFIANRRYSIFGKTDYCDVPVPREKFRFLE